MASQTNCIVWDRAPAYLQQSQISRADPDTIVGVSIFRDGLCIFPYGEAGNDWLNLDKERINNMADRIGYQQIAWVYRGLSGRDACATRQNRPPGDHLERCLPRPACSGQSCYQRLYLIMAPGPPQSEQTWQDACSREARQRCS